MSAEPDAQSETVDLDDSPRTPIQKPLGSNALWWCGLVVGLSFILQTIRMRYVSEWGDEGFFANGALRIVSGEVPYRDFQHNYAPGRIYSLALLLRSFGHDLVVVRLFWCAMHATAAGFALLVARRLMPMGFAVLAALTVTFNVSSMNKSTELAAAGLTLLTLARVLERRSSDFQSGILLGVVTLFRQDLGVVSVGLFVLCLALESFDQYVPRDREFWLRFRKRLFAARRFAAGYLLVATPFLIYFLTTGALASAAYDILLSGFVANQAMGVAFPPLLESWSAAGLLEATGSRRPLFYWPPLLYLCAIALGSRRLLGADWARGALLLITGLTGAALFLQVLPRSDWGHLQKAYFPAHLLSAFFIYWSLASFRDALKLRRLGPALGLALAAALSLALTTMQLVGNIGSPGSIAFARAVAPHYETVRFPHGELRLRREHAAELQKLVSIVSREVRESPRDEPVQMLTFPAGALFNFLFGIPTPLRYDTLRPGELRNNQPDIVDGVLETFRNSRPLFLIRTTEDSNPGLTRRLHQAAARDYQQYPASRLLLYLRK